MPRNRAGAAAVALLCLGACSNDAELEHVYVPADNYPISVEIAVPGEGRVESEVADNLHWMTDPRGARFDVPLSNPGHTRKVQFEKPGTYQVWARNAYPTEAKSNVVTVRVK